MYGPAHGRVSESPGPGPFLAPAQSMPSTGAEEYLCACYRRAAEENGDWPRRALRAAVNAVVFDLRELGMPPEKVVIRIKELIEDSCLESIRAYEAFLVRPQLAEAAVTWAIQEYFEKT